MSHLETHALVPRELDKLSAVAGSVIANVTLAYSPVVFICRYTAEDLILTDLIGRYRFPVRLIGWEVDLKSTDAQRFREFFARRYVFATPLTYIRDDRVNVSDRLRSSSEALDWLAMSYSGCRGWLTGARGKTDGRALSAVAANDDSPRIVRVAPLATWTDEDVNAYAIRWELPVTLT